MIIRRNNHKQWCANTQNFQITNRILSCSIWFLNWIATIQKFINFSNSFRLLHIIKCTQTWNLSRNSITFISSTVWTQQTRAHCITQTARPLWHNTIARYIILFIHSIWQWVLVDNYRCSRWHTFVIWLRMFMQILTSYDNP